MTRTRVLVLGGTDFVGHAFVDEAVARGHAVTVVNRGSKPPRHGVTTVVGDRTKPGALDAIGSAEFDLVVDTWSWGPKAVTDAAARARGGAVVAPGPADATIQWVDARDLAAFGLDTAATGPVNIVSPPDTTTMRDLLEACVAATASHAELRWFTPEQIERAGVAPWTELPVWIPPGPDSDAMHGADVSMALAAGLRIRPLGETVGDTWSWLRSIGGVAPQRPDRPAVGLPADKEKLLLDGGL